MHRRRPDGEREVLLLHRIPKLGAFWQGVTGAPEWEESDEDAAVREVWEETGFTVKVEALDFRYELHRSEEAAEEWLRLYGPDIEVVPEEAYGAGVPADAEPTLTPVEHDAYRWCSFDEADGLLKWEDNRRALQALRERLST